MSPAMLYRLSGLALLAGTLLVFPSAFALINDISRGDPQIREAASPWFVPLHLMSLITAMLILLGLPGMFVRLVRPAGWGGLVGFALTFWAVLMLGVVDRGLYTLGAPLVATIAPQRFICCSPADPVLGTFYLVPHLIFGVGAVLFGRAVLRAAVLPHDFDVIGAALILAGPLDAMASVIDFVPTLHNPFYGLYALGYFVSFAAFFLVMGLSGGALMSHSEEAGPLIGRPLVHGMLTSGVVISYVLVVGTVGVLVQQTRSALLISLVAIGLVAILFQPVRDRLQRAVNRLVYGERDNPYAVLSRLGRHMEAILAPETVLPTIVETIARSLKLPYVAIVLKQGDELTVAAAYGAPAETQQRFPLVYQAEPLGALVLSPRAPGEPLTPADQRLLHDLAPQIAVAVHAVRLTVDLQRLTVDLQRSRERLVTAREEERRRLRRDLHDGLGPQLASLTLKLETARNRLARDPLAETLLSDLIARTQTAVADIRRLVYALRPPALDELGLIAALREQALQYSDQGNNGLHIAIDAPDCLPELSAAVEVAVYRIAQEALTNVVRHAHARHCHAHITLDKMAGILMLEVQDDGRGLPPTHKRGIGLTSMRERAEELGGTWTIEPVPTSGTRVLARLPYAYSETADTRVVTTSRVPQDEE
jgi:signal transduction histidine kinase